jgi:hypothetical protein
MAIKPCLHILHPELESNASQQHLITAIRENNVSADIIISQDVQMVAFLDYPSE